MGSRLWVCELGVLGRQYIWVFRLCAAVTVGWILGFVCHSGVGVLVVNGFPWVAISEFVGYLW